MDISNYFYDGKLDGNILVLGQTACGKTTFVQNLGKNKLFGKIKDVSWLTKIVLLREREQNIRSCFDVPVELFYLQNVSEFDVITENFQRKKEKNDNESILGENKTFESINESILGENKMFDRVIVMDDISGLADRSN